MVVLFVLAGVYGALIGASFASFLCVVAERRPQGRSLMGRSRCACGRQLKVSENVPVVGWLRARGKASCCGAALPARLVVSEAGFGAVMAAAFVVAAHLWLSGRVSGGAAAAGLAVVFVVGCAALLRWLWPAAATAGAPNQAPCTASRRAGRE